MSSGNDTDPPAGEDAELDLEWQHSKEKKILYKDIVEGIVVTPQMKPKQVWMTRNGIYHRFKYENWRNNLRSLRKKIEKELGWAASDAADLAADRLLCPVPTVTPHGHPRWKGSEAEKLLKVDIDNGRVKLMEPKDLRETSLEYKKFPLHVFRKHIHQELRSREESPYWLVKKKKKAEKKAKAAAKRAAKAAAAAKKAAAKA